MKTTDKTPATKLASDIANTEKKAPAKKKTEQKVKTRELYKLDSTPRGKALFTYMLAIMTSLGGFTASRKVMKKEAIRAFFQTGSALSHHTRNGNLEETKTGIRLSVTGWNYFSGRLTGSTVGQEVDKPEMEILAEAISTGKVAKKTARFSETTKMVKINIPA